MLSHYNQANMLQPIELPKRLLYIYMELCEIQLKSVKELSWSLDQ